MKIASKGGAPPNIEFLHYDMANRPIQELDVQEESQLVQVFVLNQALQK
jgi:hypothetical protein